jgi:predicted Zn finger-like uncharacterized protein
MAGLVSTAAVEFCERPDHHSIASDVLTQCPNCQTIFRVTSEILRVAEGQVRCGRCQTQFDALARLIDEDDNADLEVVHTNTAREQPEQAIQVDEPAVHEDITMEGQRIEITGTYQIIEEGDEQPAIREEVTEEWVDLSDESADWQTSELVHNETPEAAMPEDHSRIRQTRTSAPDAISSTRDEPSADVELELLYTPARKQPSAKVWQWLAAPLLLILMAQIVHAHRGTLARHPKLGPPVIALYHALGLQLTPEWKLHAYEIHQWGVVSDPAVPGTLKVRASVKNLAEFPQPYPMLKLILEDRWGEQVRAREFEPREYLDSIAAADRMMAPGQQTNAIISIVDPGPDAEGFRFDVCLRGTAGTVCASEVPQG